MELSIKDKRRERIEQEIYEDSVSDAIHGLYLHLQKTATACMELAMRLETANLTRCNRTDATQAACAVAESYSIEYCEIVSTVCERVGYELPGDEILVDRVRREVSRKVNGCVMLLG